MMTIAEYDEKIKNLKTVRENSSGLERAELTSIISNLNTARLEHLTEDLRGLVAPFTAEDVAELQEIADQFEAATEVIGNANELIGNAIRIGGKLVALIA